MTERGTIFLETAIAGDSKSHDQRAGQSKEPNGLRSKVTVERLSALAGKAEGLHHISNLPDDELEELANDLVRLPELEEYKHEKVRSDIFREIVSEAKRIATEEEKPVAMEKAELADQLLFEFLADINKYVQTINRFEQMRHQQQVRMDDREYRVLLAKQDKARHIAHNNLMTSVLPLSRMLNLHFPKTLSKAADDYWEDYIKPRWFSLGQIKDRDYMEKWAVNTDTFEKASALRKKIDEVKRARQERVN